MARLALWLCEPLLTDVLACRCVFLSPHVAISSVFRRVHTVATSLSTVRQLGGHVGTLQACRFSQSGFWLATGASDGSVRLFS